MNILIALLLDVALVATVLFIVYLSVRAKSRERKMLREIFEGSRAARLVTDSSRKTVYSNEKFNLLCDVPRDKAGLKALEQLLEGDRDSQDRFRLLCENAERGSSDTMLMAVKGSQGKEYWYQIIAQPVTSWAGFVHWRIDDITERHNMEKLIRNEREKLKTFTDNAPVGFFSVDQQGRFLFANPALAGWLETTPDDMMKSCRLHDFFESVPQKARAYDITEKGGAKQIAEITLKTKSGNLLQTTISQSVIEEMGGVVRTNAVVHNLTNEQEMRQALKASEGRFQKFFEEAPLGVVLLDKDFKISDANDAFMHMLGQNMTALKNQDFTRYVTSENKMAVQSLFQNIAQDDVVRSQIEIVLEADKRQRSVEMHARKFKGSDMIVLHFIDMTEHKNLEEQFVQSQKMQAVGQLAGGVAHDFNNLLTAMTGFCDLLLLRHKPGDPSFADISQIKQNANRAANLVRQLLAFSRQQTLRPQVLDISDTLTELSHLLRRLIGVNIEMELLHGDNLPLIKADEGQLEQVLINMAVNARDAMMEQGGGGKLTIATSAYHNKKKEELAGGEYMPAGDWLKIEVCDTGCGIPPENMQRIFEPFFTTKNIGAGTGLGLATVFGIIRQTGGYINVDSKVGEGTTFTLYLPKYEAKENERAVPKKQKEAESAAQDLTGTASIMLVEDEDAVRTFSTRALQNKGYEVLGADCAESAILLLEEQDPKIDLLITDVIMPGMDGAQLAKYVLEQRPDLKIIFISGYTEDKIKDEIGADIHFLPKPFSLQQLAEKVKDVLG